MRKTDYSHIAAKYDTNERRKITLPDPVLMNLLREHSLRPFRVLDVGCGTGIYLAFNTDYFSKDDILWYGLDASDEMLAIAQHKTDTPEFIKGYAENLPYENDFFDYVTSEFAFHHFENKPGALDEITRVLKKQSVFRIKNLEPSYSPGWWVYRYFPDSRSEDYKRFWETDLIVYELENRGFTVEVNIEIKRERMSILSMYKTACNRDISELNIIDEKHYQTGLMRLKQDADLEPGAMMMNEFATLKVVAKKL